MDGNEIGIIVTTVGVLIGVILEGWEHWDDLKKKGWKPVWPKLGFGILTVSLALEIWFDARLAQDSANTKLRAALIEKSLAWRELSKLQEAAIFDTLVQIPACGAAVVSRFSDPEAKAYAQQFVEVQKRAKWVTIFNDTWLQQDSGLSVTTVDGANSLCTKALKDGLDAAQVPYKPLKVSSSDHTIVGGFQKNVTYLLVGRKPRD